MAETGGFRAAVAPYRYRFPRDHFAHDAYRTEWWYFTGHLRAKDGRRFGFELTFFRIGLEPRASTWGAGQSQWYAYQLYPAHFAITDEKSGRFTYAQTFARDALGQGFASESKLDVRAGAWRLTGTSALRPRMHLVASNGGNALDLVMQSRKPPAIHGHDGVSRKGACASCASHYYSFTRLPTTGTLRVDGVTYAVDGISWMDHEYGSDELQANQAGWDWFSLQLDDDREIMLYRLRQKDGGTTPQSSGSIVAPNGTVTYVPLSGFSIAATGSWRSPHTGATYPSGWRVRVKGYPHELELVPVMRDQELADATGTSYWEGAVEVRDATTGARLGVGYVELTGYAGVLHL
ncbi:MAG: carotenoid 1,2-hydratase [bacterium]|nr:carotenoid 1,2-hydratase [bacterium]